MVAQMLTLARMEEGDEVRAGSFQTDVVPRLGEVLRDLDSIAQTKKISIVLAGEGFLLANLEAERFKLLCTNILLNALQHSPANSKIYAEVKRAGSEARISIRDEGEGIPTESLPHIFDRFSRGEPSRSRKTGGTGLGLAICKAIVDKSGGAIKIRSEVGHGTIVEISLPVAPGCDASTKTE